MNQWTIMNFPSINARKPFPKDVGVDPIETHLEGHGCRFGAAIFLGQPFPEQSEELRLEAIMMGGCKQRFFF